MQDWIFGVREKYMEKRVQKNERGKVLEEKQEQTKKENLKNETDQ